MVGPDYPAINTILILIGLLPICVSLSVYLWRSAKAKGVADEWRRDVDEHLARLDREGCHWHSAGRPKDDF